MWSMPCSGMKSRRSDAGWGSSDSVLTAQLLDRFVGTGVEEAADDGLDLRDGLRAVQDGLVARDVVLRGAHLEQVQRAQLHRAKLAELAVARQDPGAVGTQVAVLDDDAELEREPEHAREEAQRVLVAQAARRDARTAVQLAERRRGEQVAVADDLVDDVRLGRVERHRGMADVLRGVKAT